MKDITGIVGFLTGVSVFYIIYQMIKTMYFMNINSMLDDINKTIENKGYFKHLTIEKYNCFYKEKILNLVKNNSKIKIKELKELKKIVKLLKNDLIIEKMKETIKENENIDELKCIQTEIEKDFEKWIKTKQ